MPRNVEIKARLSDFSRQYELASTIATNGPTTIHQRDVFFRATKGRLKLRYFSDADGELIAYDRPNQTGPKTSNFFISKTREPKQLHQVLNESLGTIAEVVKRRELFLVGRTRVHLDRVQQLGDFLELEVVLADGDAIEDGIQEANQLMSQLEVDPDWLVDSAYVDLLLSEQSPD